MGGGHKAARWVQIIWKKSMNGRSEGSEQCGEERVGLGTGLGQGFCFPFKGTAPEGGILGWKVVSNPRSTHLAASSPVAPRI